MKLIQPPNTVKYDVKSTDTLSCIALKFNTTPSELSRLNHLASTLLYPGQTLFVPENVNSPPTEKHRIPLQGPPSPIRTTAYSPIKTKSQSFSHSPVSSPTKILTSPRHNTVLVNNHDTHLENLLQRQDSEEEFSKRFLRIKSRYITDGQGVVSGVLLVTPQTIMFNPSVSDHLVMDRGRDAYLVKLPLKALSSVTVFEEIAAMVSDDLSRQYIPAFEQYRPISPLRPGVIVCQETGEEYAIQESPSSIPSSSLGKQEGQILLKIAEKQIGHNKLNANTKSIDDDKGLSTFADSIKSKGINTAVGSATATTTTSSGLSTTEDDQGFGSMTYSTTKDSSLADTLVHTSCSAEDVESSTTPTPTALTATTAAVNATTTSVEGSVDCSRENIDNQLSSTQQQQEDSDGVTKVLTNAQCEKHDSHNDSISPHATHDHGHNEFGDFHSASTPKHSPFTTPCSHENPIKLDSKTTSTPLLHNSEESNNKKYLSLNLVGNEDCEGCSTATSDAKTEPSTGSTKKSDFQRLQRPADFDHASKDSGISDMTGSHFSTVDSTTEGVAQQHIISPDRQGKRSSLSDEARKWLGKHSVSSEGSMSPDLEPRPASSVEDPLIYISVKVSKRYWCPALAKHNAIMGIPPNRDQKRRQHWFAIPREKVDQFYGFIVHWLPELNSRASTPSSEVNNDLDEGLNIVDDTFASSPATSFGWEKLTSEDAESMGKLRVDSIQSASSRVSLRSLDEEVETSCDSNLLTKDQLKRLVRSLPSLTVGHMMELVYSTDVHGISLKTLYRNFEDYDTTALLVVRDENHRAFGAFLSHPPAKSDSFYGTGECLIFSFVTEKKVKTYKWSGENSFFIKGSKTSLTVGGGEGVIGLWLDEDLYHGRTHACSTFNNELLSENEDFICTGLEAWAFV